MAKQKRHQSSSRREPKEFEEEVVQIDRVTRVVKGGRRLRFRATLIIGDRKGRVGIGTGKANEVSIAIHKAVSAAKKHLMTIPLINDTIPHDVRIKFKSSRLLIMPASQGTGIIAGGPMRKMAELAGIKNILAKYFGTKNKLVNTQAAFLALSQLKPSPNPRGLTSEAKPPTEA